MIQDSKGIELPVFSRGPIPDAPHAYLKSVMLQKARTRRAVIFDKDGTIQSGRNPSESELTARKSLMQKYSEYVCGVSTAQTPELGMSSATYEKSFELGFGRKPARFLLEDGTRTSELEHVRELSYLQDVDVLNSFGVGLYLLQQDGGYLADSAFSNALGGAAWRRYTMAELERMDPSCSFMGNLARIEKDGEYDAGSVDVEQLPFRLQFDYSERELEQRERFHLSIMLAQLKGALRNVALVDESNIKKGRYTTYLVPKRGRKERALGRLFGQIEVHAGISLREFKVVIAGDTLTDLQSGLFGLLGAQDLVFILAAGSRLSGPLYTGKLTYAGMSLLWSRSNPTLVPRYEATAVPGVFKFRAHRFQPWRTIILADYAPWSSGLGCAESVLASMEYLKF